LVKTQNQSPLFTILPKELRDLVFEFALTDDKAQSLESLIKRNALKLRLKINVRSPSNDIAVNLLRTCRAAYLETWYMPLSRNGYIVYDLHATGRAGMKLYELLPWQLALIQSLDLTVQQYALEGSVLYKYIHRNASWQPGERHKGVYVTPRRYKTERGPRAMVEYPDSFNFSLVPADKHEPRHYLSHILGNHARYPDESPPPWSSAMRVTLARPIIQLTLRIQHSDWWSWTDPPDSTDELHHLGLDPAVGDGRANPLIRPTAPRMRALAEARRAGHHPEIQEGVGWASTIALMPDLRRLELVLETFASKKRQLDSVVEAAKTWRFALTGTKYELVWDGDVGMSSWSTGASAGATQGGAWHATANEYEVRNVRFVRRRVD
jgi:hypothetical protein